MLERLGLTGADLAERLELDGPRRGTPREPGAGAARDARRRGRDRPGRCGRRPGDGGRRRDVRRARTGAIRAGPRRCASTGRPASTSRRRSATCTPCCGASRELVPDGDRSRSTASSSRRSSTPRRSTCSTTSCHRAEAALGLDRRIDPGRAAHRVGLGRRHSCAEIARRSPRRVSRASSSGSPTTAPTSGLPAIGNDHPLADWARAEIVAVAGAVGVPAIDGMTLDYPVADPALDAAANRTRWLDRMRLVYDDTVRARELGMLGKWVGHPAQLFAVLLAYETGLHGRGARARGGEARGVRGGRRGGPGRDDDRGRHERSRDRPARPGRAATGDGGRAVRSDTGARAGGHRRQAEIGGGASAPTRLHAAGDRRDERTARRLGGPVPRGLRGR